MMLLIVIPLAWLALVGLVVVLCKAAARGDAQQARAIASPGRRIAPGRQIAPGRRIAPGLVVWDDAPLTRGRLRAGRSRRARREPTTVV